MIIFDSSPLIHLTKIGKIGFILNFFEYILIPPAVNQEVIQAGINEGYDDALLLKGFVEKGRIREEIPSKVDSLLEKYLHQGESQTILLGEDFQCVVVIDEKKGRMIAEQRKLTVLSTLDLIFTLLKEKEIDYSMFIGNLGKYAKRGWINPSIIELYLKEGKKYE